MYKVLLIRRGKWREPGCRFDTLTGAFVPGGVLSHIDDRVVPGSRHPAVRTETAEWIRRWWTYLVDTAQEAGRPYPSANIVIWQVLLGDTGRQRKSRFGSVYYSDCIQLERILGPWETRCLLDGRPFPGQKGE